MGIKLTFTGLDRLCVNVLRGLAVDQVEAAKSGHPGMPLGAAPMAYCLWTRYLRHSPANPAWPDRDRFILSAGHGSALLYGLLHLCGYDLSLDDLRAFRQWGSRTPGHPELGLVPGVEMTTGPLGQGFATGVGMAAGERSLAADYNRPGHNIIDHYTYAIVSDGDLMEGISSEAASLAGHQGLGKLIYLYDDNGITIEGRTDLAFSEDVAGRFTAYGWQVLRVADGNDLEAIAASIEEARGECTRPSLIMVRTRIGYASPKEDDSAVHGSPLGPEAAKATKIKLGLPPDQSFFVPDEVYGALREVRERGASSAEVWGKSLASYQESHPALAAELEGRLAGKVAVDWELPAFTGSLATRSASGAVLNGICPGLPSLIGGSGDLAPSNDTFLKGQGEMSRETPAGRNIHFGVREHAMGAFLNGLALHGGFRPFGGTFLAFYDYMKPAVRMAALMELPVTFVYTHDSIGLGEDGPTHQPVEHLASMRAVPNLVVIRPADAIETAAAWKVALARKDGPVALVLSRQKLPVLGSAQAVQGAYILAEAKDGPLKLILIASGSEVSLIMEAKPILEERGIPTRVVSMPSWELFAAQPAEYREGVLPTAVKARLSVEAAATLGWERYVGSSGGVIGLDHFGASAPAEVLFREFGFTAENVVAKAIEVLGKN